MAVNMKNGILAAQMRELHSIPLFSPNGFLINQGILQVTGMALAADGDPSTVSVATDPGIVASFEYPLPNPGAADVYWYWPNSGMSAFRLNIDLGATRHKLEAYQFQILFAGRQQGALERIRASILVPKHLSDLENYPESHSLMRVQRYDTISGVSMKGLTDAWRIIELAKHHGWSGGPVLDWGVGHGRVARHLRRFGVEEVFGIDIDPQNVGWAREHLPHLDVTVGPLMPPTPYPDGRFSLIYGISVMTHLTRSVQEAWLAEISRLLRPGGACTPHIRWRCGSRIRIPPLE